MSMCRSERTNSNRRARGRGAAPSISPSIRPSAARVRGVSRYSITRAPPAPTPRHPVRRLPSSRHAQGQSRTDTTRRPAVLLYRQTGPDATMNLPDLELEFQLVAELLPHPLLDLVDEVEHVGGLGSGMGDDE